MKKAIIIFVILFFGISPVYAADNDITFTMYVKENCRPGKAFDLYISLDRPSTLGDIRFNITYDSHLLTLKNVSLEETNNGNMLSYNDNNGTTDIIYFPEYDQNIILRFQPISLQADHYDFQAFIYEACDIEGNYISSDKAYRLSLTVSDDKGVIQTQTITDRQETMESKNISVSLESKITDYSETSKTKNVSSSLAEESNKETAETIESSQAEIYRVIHEDSKNDQTPFFIFAGGTIIIAVCLVLVYKSGFKNGKETEKKNDTQ